MLESKRGPELHWTGRIGFDPKIGNGNGVELRGILDLFDFLSMERATAPEEASAPTKHVADERLRRRERGEQLLQGLRHGGDRERIFHELHSLYARWIQLIFRRRGFPFEDCRELTQETFLRVVRSLERFRSESRFETWIYGIAINVSRNAMRNDRAGKRAGREISIDAARPTPVGREGAEALDLPAPDRAPLEKALARERLRLVEETLAQMPARMRQCLQLRLYQEKKYREIADLMQISTDAVKSHLGEGKKRIRLALGGHLQ